MALLFAYLFLGSGHECPKVNIVNETKRWESVDRAAVKSAAGRCSVHFPESPCLKKFIKKSDKTYWAICGSANN